MKKSGMKILLVCCLGISLLSFQSVAASASLRRSKDPRGSEGMTAPDFTLETVGGATVSLKDFRGKGVVLFFFTTWCAYCRQKLPALSQQQSQLESQNIKLLLIDSGESKAKVASFATKQNISFDILLDGQMKTAGDYGVGGVPTFFLVSQDGTIVYEGNDLPRDYAELLNCP